MTESMEVGEGFKYGNYEKLARWLQGSDKNINVDDIDLNMALEEFTKKFLPNTVIEDVVEEDPTNSFTYAGRVLQRSADLYADKVDDLDNYVKLLMADLTTQRKRIEKKKREKEKRPIAFDGWHGVIDEIKIGEHTRLIEEDEAEREPIEYITDPPSCMVDLFSSSSGNRIPLYGYHGDFLGYQSDFATGSAWTMSSTGAFSLAMNYNIPKGDQIEEENDEDIFDDADAADFDATTNEPGAMGRETAAVGGKIGAVGGGMKHHFGNIDEPLANDHNTFMEDLKKERIAQQNRERERIAEALEPHDPYEVIAVKNESDPKKKIHQPITKQKTGKASRPSFNAGYLLNKKPLGKGARKPDDCLKDEADKEFLARRKILKQRALEMKGLLVENAEEEDEPIFSEDEDEQGFSPDINFDELEVHDEEEHDDDERMPPTAIDRAARNAAARQALETEENKKAYKEWEEHIKRVQEEEKDLPEFDIGQTMKEILKSMESKSGSVPFREVAPMTSVWDVNRMFLGTLILANHGNVNMIETERDNLPENYSVSDLPVNKVRVKLIDAKKTEDHIRPYSEIEAEERNRKDSKRRSSTEEDKSLPKSARYNVEINALVDV